MEALQDVRKLMAEKYCLLEDNAGDWNTTQRDLQDL